MNCFKVRVPDGRRVRGFTAGGQPVPVYPGEYLVHCLAPKIGRRAPPVLRFVGADALGRDVHVPLPAGDDLRGLVTSMDALPPEAAGQTGAGSPDLELAG